MIVFGTAVTDRDAYEREALPGIQRACELDSLVLTRSGLPIRAAYNEIMDEAAAQPRLEALALLHQDLELTDDSLPERARRLFAEPRAGLFGPLGARDVTLHLRPSSRTLYGAVFAPGVDRRFSTGVRRVDGVDGALLVLAPWVVRGLRFGEIPGGAFHGYDADISLRLAALGGEAFCDDVPYFHHRPPKDDFGAQRDACLALARAWDPELRPPEWDSSFQT